MFYSHEILTSRKYGVATVWLVATLGAKSSQKRITRKQILDVDVTKACSTIIDPAAPMALRLQGSLLLGVSRVYLQQAGYVLSDAQNAQHTMVMLLRSVQNTALDPEAGKARPEQLILQDDPSFLPDFALPGPEVLADLNLNFDLDIARSGESQSLTPFGSQVSHSSEPIGGLILPSSSPHHAAEFRIQGDEDLAELGEPGPMLDADDMLDIPELGFTIGDDGDLIDLPVRSSVARTPGAGLGSAMHSDAGASAKVRRDHEEGRQAGNEIPVDDAGIDLPILGEGLPEADAFPIAEQTEGSEFSEQIQSTSTASAPMRRKGRAPRTIPKDYTMEISNKDIASWKNNYLASMKMANQRKITGHNVQQAKKNAEHYVWSSGLGGFGDRLLGDVESHPFNMFIGDNFFELVTGVSRKKVAGKRKKVDRDSGIDDDTQDESRHVRQKTAEAEVQAGRGAEDDDFFMAGEDDAEVELPREAVSALDDQQLFSAMPWNMSASKRGSSVVPRSGISGRAGSLEPMNRGSRLVSASPLHGRGQPLQLDPLQHLYSDGDFAYGVDDFALPDASSDYSGLELLPPTSIRVRDALSAEGGNFLTFVEEAIAEKRTRMEADLEHAADPLQAEAAADIDDMTFKELLPPSENTKVVACQGLMMVLGLGTKGLLDVQQSEHFGEITLKVTEKGSAAQLATAHANDQHEEEKHSEDWDDPDQASQEDTNHDSLYDA